MIQAWLARKAGILPLIDRISFVERELEQAKATIVMLADRAANAEAAAATASRASDDANKRLKVLTRAMRVGTTHLKRLLVASEGLEAGAKSRANEMERLKAALTLVENRIESEAEQARRSVIGLFQKIEGIRSHGGGDPADRSDRAFPSS